MIIDVSEHNGVIDWERVRQEDTKVTGAMIHLSSWRISSGGNRPDHQAAANWAGAKNTKINVFPVSTGGYVRANPWANSPSTEAYLFHRLIEEFYDDDFVHLIPAIDIEPTDHPEYDKLVDWPAWLREFIQEWDLLTNGARLQVYTSGSFFESKYGGVLDLPLNVSFWVGDAAQFNHAPDAGGKTKYTFSGRTLLHQYSHKGTVPGITGAVDLNAVMPYTDLIELSHWTG